MFTNYIFENNGQEQGQGEEPLDWDQFINDPKIKKESDIQDTDEWKKKFHDELHKEDDPPKPVDEDE